MILSKASSEKRKKSFLLLAPPLTLLLSLDQHLVVALLEAIELVLLQSKSYRERDPDNYIHEE